MILTSIRRLPILLGGALPALLAGCQSTSPGPATLTQAVAVADLTRSGHLDVIGANTVFEDGEYQPGFLSTRLANPTSPGAWQSPIRTATAENPVAMAVGDFNGDGLPDVAVATGVATLGAYGVSLFFQVAGQPGTFATPVTLSTGTLRPVGLALADLDGNGRLDVAVAATGASAVQVFFQASDGTFGSPVALTVGGAPWAVAAADLTGSGTGTDLVVATDAGTVSVLLRGSTPGTFLPFVDYPAGVQPVAVVTADLNGDGHPDLLLADYQGALIYLLASPTGDGTFQPAVARDAGDDASCALAVADLNGDGLLDVVVANAGPPGWPGSEAIFFQDAAGGGALLSPVMYRGYVGPLSVAVGDVNGDGLPDLIIADGGPAVRIQDPATAGHFRPPYWLRQ